MTARVLLFGKDTSLPQTKILKIQTNIQTNIKRQFVRISIQFIYRNQRTRKAVKNKNESNRPLQRIDFFHRWSQFFNPVGSRRKSPVKDWIFFLTERAQLNLWIFKKPFETNNNCLKYSFLSCQRRGHKTRFTVRTAIKKKNV